MFNTLLKLFSFFNEIWNTLSDKQKEKIVDIIVDSFDFVLRRYFHESKSETNNG